MNRKFSSQTIDALTETVTGNSVGIYRKGWELEEFFRNIHVDCSIDGRTRFSVVRECLGNLNDCEPDKVDEAIQAVCDPRDYLDEPDTLTKVVDYLNQRLEYDGFQIRRDGKFHRLTPTNVEGLSVAAVRSEIALTDYQSVRRDFERALNAVAEDDPESAITSACSTIESVCKCILDEMNKPYPKKQDIRGLASEVGKHLKLSPGRTDIPDNIQNDVKQVLSGLVNVTSGIGALRTHGGDAHGSGIRNVSVDSRIARLTINAASTISLFYIETWDRQRPA